MDWDRVIERNRDALKRILAALVVMAGFADVSLPFSCGRRCRGEAEADEGCCEERRPRTLPRHLHRAVLRLLRPAEAAARRLIVVAARGLVVEPPKPNNRRLPQPDPKAAHAVLRSLGIAVVMSPVDIARAAAESRAASMKAAAHSRRPPILPLVDPLRRTRLRPRTVPPHAAPRIISFDGAVPHRLPPPPARHDPIDARRLGLRLRALASALDDLPAQARRFARWKSRTAIGAQNKETRDAAHAQGRPRRLSPLKPGRPPGWRSAGSRRPTHEVHEVLADLHYFAREALAAPDTS